METTFNEIDDTACDAYARHGAICLRGLFTDWVDLLRDGVARNHDEPGPYFSENVVAGDEGRFWDDYCNWTRIPEFHRFITESPSSTAILKFIKTVDTSSGVVFDLTEES